MEGLNNTYRENKSAHFIWIILLIIITTAVPQQLLGQSFIKNDLKFDLSTISSSNSSAKIQITKLFKGTISGKGLIKVAAGKISSSYRYENLNFSTKTLTVPTYQGSARINFLDSKNQLLAEPLIIVPTVPLPANTVVFPIEILDDGVLTKVKQSGQSAGKNEVIAINFATTPTSVAWIELTLFNVMYPDQATIKINNGSPIPLNPLRVVVVPPYDKLSWRGNDMTIDRLVKVRVPLSTGLLTKTNTITFSFLKTNGAISGFRVIDLRFIDAGGSTVSPLTNFVKDNPLSWVAPSSDPGAPQRGLQLWHEAILTDNPNNPVAIRGKCADCHGGGFKSVDENGKILYAHSGKDLQKFALSNKSIITRAKFHGLTDQQAADIASYIRSLPEVPTGRPWSAYQPGTTQNVKLTDKPAEDLASGMGFESIVDDRTMVQNLLEVVNNTSIPLDSRLDGFDIRNINASILTQNIFEWWSRKSFREVTAEDNPYLAMLKVRDNTLRTYVEEHPSLSSQEAKDVAFKVEELQKGYFGVVRPFTFDQGGLARDAAEAELIHGAHLSAFMNMWDLTRAFERSGVNAGTTIASGNVPFNTSFGASPRFVAPPWNTHNLKPFRFTQLSPATIYAAISWDYMHLVQTAVVTAPVDGVENPINASINYGFGYRTNTFEEAFRSGYYNFVGPFYATILQAAKVQSHGKPWGEYNRDELPTFVRQLLEYSTQPAFNLTSVIKLSEASKIARAAISYKFASLSQFTDAQLIEYNTVQADNGPAFIRFSALDKVTVENPMNCSNNFITINGADLRANGTPVGIFACLERELNTFGESLEAGSQAKAQRDRLYKLFS